MRSLFLTFKPDTSEDERAALLDRLKAGGGVSRAAKSFPESANSELSRIAFVEAESDKAARRILDELRRDPAIESADPPARRPCFKSAHMRRRV